MVPGLVPLVVVELEILDNLRIPSSMSMDGKVAAAK